MKIIDAHIHTAFESKLLGKGAKESCVDYSLEGLKKEMEESGVEYAVSMGLKSGGGMLLDRNAETPIIKDGKEDICDKNIILVGGINPYKAGKENLSEVEKALKSGKIKGLKIYLGYFDKYAYDDAYKPIYELAAKHNVPVIFHTGDVYDEKAKLKFSQPLDIDDVAVDFRDTKFIIAHTGNPWTDDAGEVIYKNSNVYGDLSGLFVGDKDTIENVDDKDLEDIIKAYRWVNNPNKFLYGSDWPIVPMKHYIKLIEKIIKEATYLQDREEHLERVFSLNAKELFNIQ